MSTDPIAPVARIDERSQELCLRLLHVLLDIPYALFGRTSSSPQKYNVVFPNSFGSARRKPVTPQFQKFAEDYFWPIMCLVLFGRQGWQEMQPFLLAHKVNTLVIGEDEDYYGQSIYHLHIDGHVGKMSNDMMQRRRYRFLVSFVPSSTEEDLRGSTVYLREQPKNGCASVKYMHKWASEHFEECGLSRGNRRPLYKVHDTGVFRAAPGDVFVHASHGYGTIGAAFPIHAEANPCPNGRVYHAIDFDDIIDLERRENGKVAGVSSTRRVPVVRAIGYISRAGDKSRIHGVVCLLRQHLRCRILDNTAKLLCFALAICIDVR